MCTDGAACSRRRARRAADAGRGEDGASGDAGARRPLRTDDPSGRPGRPGRQCSLALQEARSADPHRGAARHCQHERRQLHRRIRRADQLRHSAHVRSPAGDDAVDARGAFQRVYARDQPRERRPREIGGINFFRRHVFSLQQHVLSHQRHDSSVVANPWGERRAGASKE